MNTITTYLRPQGTNLLKIAGWIALVVAFLFLGRGAPTAEATVRTTTIPPLLTVLVGPVSAVSDSAWVVAGVTVEIKDTTRINERMGSSHIDRWARVEGVPNGSNGLIAHRIKLLPPLPFIQIHGRLDKITADSLQVGGILVSRTDSTLIVGAPAVGSRVGVKAILEGETLIALQVHPMGSPQADDDGDDDDAEIPDADKVELIGQVMEHPDGQLVGPWLISTLPVSVTETTAIKQPVGAPILGAWVKVEGSATGDGGILAHEMKTIETRSYHKLEGVLDALSDTEITVNGIVIALDPSVKIEGTPTPGRRVEVRARLDDETQALYAIHVEIEENDDDGHEGTRHIAGAIHTMPVSGLIGEYQIGVHNIRVTDATVIDEHKGVIEIGAQVRVEVFKSKDEPLIALSIVVLHGENDDDDDDDDHNEYVEFEGAVESLPTGTLLGDWVVDGRTIAVSQRTTIKGNPAQIVINTRVEIEGYERADGVIEARKIEAVHDDNGNDEDHVKFEGEIEQLPRNGLIGLWIVAGREVKVTPQTRIEGNIAVGVNVEVEGREHKQGEISAEKIEVIDD